MKRHILIIMLLVASQGMAQKYIVEKSETSFFSEATIENISAENAKATSIFNNDDGSFAYIIPINQFQFEKALMQEHFNEKYLESEKYPKSTFKGKIIDYVAKDGLQKVVARGQLSIHGVTKEVELPGTIEFKNGKVYVKSTFTVELKDYKIKIPKLLWQNIAEKIEVKVNFEYKKYEG